MKIHIQGICGTFMSGVAILARAMGHSVSGSDKQAYPPMSTQLANQGIEVLKGYAPEHIESDTDCVVVGNVMSRGNPQVEYVLNNRQNYISGPQWLYEHVLKERKVIAVAGTHGKTTTASMLAWILEYAGLKPGYLIGGIPNNFGVSVNLGESEYFVIEADEYDTAFFDKRSKFLHYHPHIVLLNNIEFDHADIFPNLDAIIQQFRFLLRIIPSDGTVVFNQEDARVREVCQAEPWSKQVAIGENSDWQVVDCNHNLTEFSVTHRGQNVGRVNWQFFTQHNISNALSAIATAYEVGVEPAIAIKALSEFKGVKRRMEYKGLFNQVHVFEDFAHHPTAIASSLDGLRRKAESQRVVAVLELGSNTMKMAKHQDYLADSLKQADEVFIYASDFSAWDLPALKEASDTPISCYDDLDDLVQTIADKTQADDLLCLLSNTGFAARAFEQLKAKWC